MEEIYMDNNSTTMVHGGVAKAMVKVMTVDYANPSSSHRLGQRAKAVIDNSRDAVAKMLQVPTESIFFTSGATESNNIVFNSLKKLLCESCGSKPKIKIITSKIEHASILRNVESLAEQCQIVYLKVDKYGIINIRQLEQELADHSYKTLVTVMWANNEIGTVEPIEEIGQLCRKHGAHFHCDATQWAGKYPCFPESALIDSMSMTAHKFHGPKGTGLLYMRTECGSNDGPRLNIRCPLMYGGGQESGMRAGTENTQGILGMALAMKLCLLGQNYKHVPISDIVDIREKITSHYKAAMGHAQKMNRLRLYLLREILVFNSKIVVNGHAQKTLPNTVSICVPGIDSRKAAKQLSKHGLCINTGSACSVGKRSSVLEAIGIPEDLERGAFRISLSQYNTFEECQAAIKILKLVLA